MICCGAALTDSYQSESQRFGTDSNQSQICATDNETITNREFPNDLKNLFCRAHGH